MTFSISFYDDDEKIEFFKFISKYNLLSFLGATYCFPELCSWVSIIQVIIIIM